ncbi:MAG: SRPBCC family protein [Sphingomonadaceae bacterium]
MTFKPILLAAALTGVGLAGAANGEVVKTTEDDFVTRDTARVAATPMETWLMLIKPGQWWNPEHTWSGDAANMTLTPQAGGCFCERIPGKDQPGAFALEGSAMHAMVVQAFPLNVLRMRGGLGPLQGEPATGVLTITLKPVDGGTRIMWEYNVGGPMRYTIDEIAPAVDGVMSEQLHRLQKKLGALEEKGDGKASPEPDKSGND